MTYLRLARRRQPVLKTVIIWALLMVPTSALLYGTSTHVRALENKLAAVNSQIEMEKDALRVLKAEWAYQNHPQRLSSRSQKYLSLKKPAQPVQIAAFEQVPLRIAYRPTPETVVAEGIAIAPAQTTAPRVLARPIVFETTTLSALHTIEEAKIPSATSWTQKVVSLFGLPADGQVGKNRAAP